jgi:hypothetical protein
VTQVKGSHKEEHPRYHPRLSKRAATLNENNGLDATHRGPQEDVSQATMPHSFSMLINIAKQRSVLRGNNDRQRSSSQSNLEARKSGVFPSQLSAGDRAVNPSAIERLRTIKEACNFFSMYHATKLTQVSVSSRSANSLAI